MHGLTDVNDVWSVRLRRGTMYRIAFNSQPCANATFRRGNVTLLHLGCGGYATFTPGPDGGGRYSLEVRATPRPEQQAYRLRVVAAAADDVGVGLELSPGSIQGDACHPAASTSVTSHHFDVERLSEVRLGLARAARRSFSLTLLDDAGNRISTDDTRVEAATQPRPVRRGSPERSGHPVRDYRLALRLRA